MIRAYVNNEGQISTPSMLEFKEELLSKRNKEIEIIIKELQRTSPQNRALHWGLNIFAKGLKEIGYKMEMPDLKYELKINGFFGWVFYETKEGMKKRPKDTHELSIDECVDAFDKIQLTAQSSYNIIIPDPDPNYKEHRSRQRND